MTPDQLRLTVGRIVRSLRERLGRGRPWLADECHFSVSQLKNIENGYRLPNRDDLRLIENAIGTGGLLADLVDCGENDVRRRTVLQSLVLLGAAVPGLVPTLRRVDGGQVDVVSSMTSQLRALDNAHGGIHSHHVVAAYLHSVALPMLRGGGPRLRAVVAELMLLTGWTAYDAGEHASAGAYFGQARSLATDSGEHALVGEVLAAMSHQAAYLGNGVDALALADAALASAVKSGMPALAAEAHMSAAHGAAINGDPKTAAVLLGRAARDLDRADSGPGWSAFLSGAYLHARTGHSLLASGDLTGAVSAARSSLDMEPGYDRGRMFNLALLTTALIDAGEIDEACSTGRETLTMAEGISSARADEYLRRIALRLLPHRGIPNAAELTASIAFRLSPVEQDGLEADH